jgi:DNA-directed RNA polymerase subunit RPC12/RpoP
MSVSFECLQCEADFELEVADMVKDPTLVKCPNCGIKANSDIVEGAVIVLDEALEQLNRLRRKFLIGISIEPEEMLDRFDDDLIPDDDDDALWLDEPEEEEEDL